MSKTRSRRPWFAALCWCAAAAPALAQSNPPIANFADSFNGTSIDATKWTVTTNLGSASEGGGTLNVSPNANTGAAQIVVSGSGAYTLIGSAASVQVPAVVSSGCNVNNSFQITPDSGNRLQWWFECGNLSAMYAVNGIETTVATLPYSPTTHLWWRIRESGGTVFWDTSADGTTWTQQASIAWSNRFPLTAVHVRMYSETYGTGLTAPGTAKYANLNTATGADPPPPSGCGGSCVSNLVDSFGGTSIDLTKWAVTATQGTATEGGGALKLTPNANTGAAQLIVSSVNAYSLTGSSSQVRVPGVVSSACNVNNSFQITQDGAPGNRVQWWFECGNLYAMYAINGAETTLATLAYSATVHAWWRIRETGGTVFWETSSDASTWTVRASRATSTLFPVSAIHVRFYAETYATGLASPGQAKYSNLGTCTPTTCVAEGKNCGSISDGCGGTLSCGTCTAPQTCGANFVCGTGPTLDADGVMMLRPSNPSGKSFRLGAQNPTQAVGLTMDPASATSVTEGNLSFWTTPGHPITYASGGSGVTVRFHIEASGGTQVCNYKTCAIPNGYISNPGDLKNTELTAYVRVRTNLGVHTSFSWIVRGGQHTSSTPELASCVEMRLPYGTEQPDAAKELDHPKYDFIPLQPFFDFAVADSQWIGVKMLSYVRPDATSTYNALYVDTAPFDVNGHPTNQFRLYSEWIDQDGVFTGRYTNAALWGGWRQTLRIDGWQAYDLAILSAREILPP